MTSRRDVALPLPHAFPFLMVDRFLLVDAGRWAVALRRLTADDPLIGPDGHLRSVMLLEAMAQTAGVAVATRQQTRQVGVLARVDRFRCRPLVGAGEDLLITVRVVRRFGATIRAHASVRSGPRRCAATALVLHVGGASVA